jgi:hypothetical protein
VNCCFVDFIYRAKVRIYIISGIFRILVLSENLVLLTSKLRRGRCWKFIFEFFKCARTLFCLVRTHCHQANYIPSCLEYQRYYRPTTNTFVFLAFFTLIKHNTLKYHYYSITFILFCRYVCRYKVLYLS